MHHALDCCADPRTAMREVCKVLRPGGRLLICGFNPISLWGVRRLAARLFDDAFSDVRFVNPWRLLDWMAVLGIEADEGVQYLMYRPPLGIGSFERKLWVRLRDALERARMPLGGVVLRARSQERCRHDAPALVLRRCGMQTSRRWSSRIRRCAIRGDVAVDRGLHGRCMSR